MLPTKLLETLAIYDEDAYHFQIIKTEQLEDTFTSTIILNLQDYNDGLVTQEWKIEASNHIKSNVSSENTEFIEIPDDHPLLWEFMGIQSDLYFSGHCGDQLKLVYDLFTVHKKLFDGYIDFDLPCIEWSTGFKPFRYTNGLLAKGPKKLMQEYATCLQLNGVNYSIIDGYYSEVHDLKILFLGRSYIIAKNFSFTQIDRK